MAGGYFECFKSNYAEQLELSHIVIWMQTWVSHSERVLYNETHTYHMTQKSYP